MMRLQMQLVPLVLLFAMSFPSTCPSVTAARAVAPADSCVKNTTYPNRLPEAVIQPRHYQLNVSLPDPSADHPTDSSYDGSITLTMDVYAPTTCIILHAENIVISTSTVTFSSAASGSSLTSSSIEYTTDGNSFLIIHFATTLPLGSGTLVLPFIAHYAQQPGQGLFLSDNRYEPTDYPPLQIKQLAKQFQQQHRHKLQSRRDHIDRMDQGDVDVASTLARDALESDRYLFPSTTVPMPGIAAGAGAGAAVRVDPPKSILRMFATQFESTFARRAFPCMDEPALKAVWRARITVPSGLNLTVLFNSDLEFRSSPYMSNGELVEDWNFLPMKHVQSSYLVAIAVGHFDYVETYSQGVRFRVYTPPGRAEYGRFGLNVSSEIVAWFGKKWNFSYADMNSKMDQISVPGLYQNAMENWGLLTYYPPFLLADTVSPSRIALELVAQVTVHEIAHQWFGDTITMPYWSSEYLQEGYARFLQYVGVDALFPEWNVFDAHAPSTAFGDISFFGWPYSTALRVDFAGLAPPIVVPENQKALSNMFYEKGASVNRMWYDYFGASTWHSIFAYHINTHRYSNPSVTDLIASFNHVVPTRDWTQPILSWLTQPNLPVIRLHWDSLSSRIIASQSPLSRFTVNGIHSRWWIPAVPISISSILLPQTYTFALEFESTSTVQILSPPFPSHAQARDIEMIGNMNFTHYMLISYGPEQWPAVIKAYTQPEPDRVGYELRSQFINTVVLLTQMSHETVDVLIELTDSISGLFIRCLYIGRTSDVLDWSRTLLNGWLRINTALSSNELTKQVFPVSHIYQRIYGSIGSASSSILSIITWDSQIGESAQMSALRDLWTFWSVYYGVPSSLATAVNYYITAPDPTRIAADIKRAVLWAVVAQSDQEPYTSYYANLLSLVTANTTSFDDRALLYRTLVGAVPTLGQCLQVSQLITTAISEPITQLPLFSYGMKYSHSLACIRQYRYEYQQVANQLWKIQGAAATNTILNGLSGALSAGSDRFSISSWLSSSGFVSSDQLYGTLTQIDINQDIVTVNTPFQAAQQQS